MPYSDPFIDKQYHDEYRKRWRAENRTRVRDQDSAHHANVRAEKYGTAGRITTLQVREILSAGKCFYCGGAARLGIDHVIPLHAGGSNTVDNIVPCCHACNASKWRSDRPYRWSRVSDACLDCHTTEQKHLARGRCSACYQRATKRARVASTGG